MSNKLKILFLFFFSCITMGLTSQENFILLKEKKIIQESLYVEPSTEFSENFLEKIDKGKAKKFYREILRSNIPTVNKIYIFGFLVSLGELSLINDIQKISLPEGEVGKFGISREDFDLIKINEISYNLQLFRRKNIGFGSLEAHSLSLYSYRDLSTTPDMAFDGDLKTYWQISNVSDPNQSAVEIRDISFCKKKYEMGILSGDIPKNALIGRPKLVRVKLIREADRKVVIDHFFKLKDNSNFQKMFLKMDFKEKLHFFFENIINNFDKSEMYVIKFEVIDIFDKNSQTCNINEIEIKPLP